MSTSSSVPARRYVKLSPNEQAALIQRRREEKRRTRLLQVREQEKEFARQVRGNVQRKQEEERKVLEKHLQEQTAKSHQDELHRLEQELITQYSYIGQGHRDAIDIGQEEQRLQELRLLLTAQQRTMAKKRQLAAMKELSENQLRSITNQDKVLKSRSIALRTEKERSRKIVSKPHQQSSILVMELDPHLCPHLGTKRVRGVECFASTYFHLPDNLVHKESTSDTCKPDANQAAQQVSIELKEHEKHVAALHQEQQETAWLRHKHALAKVKLEKDKVDIIKDLSLLMREDRTQRQRVIQHIPSNLFQPVQQRLQEQEVQQCEMEHAFEKLLTGGLSGKSTSSQLTSVTTPAPSKLLPATPQPHFNHLTPISPPIHPSQNISTTDEDDNDSEEVKESLRMVPPVVIPFVKPTQDIELSIETLTPSINPSESSISRGRDDDSALVTSTETQSERQDIGDSTQSSGVMRLVGLIRSQQQAWQERLTSRQMNKNLEGSPSLQRNTYDLSISTISNSTGLRSDHSTPLPLSTEDCSINSREGALQMTIETTSGTEEEKERIENEEHVEVNGRGYSKRDDRTQNHVIPSLVVPMPEVICPSEVSTNTDVHLKNDEENDQMSPPSTTVANTSVPIPHPYQFQPTHLPYTTMYGLNSPFVHPMYHQYWPYSYYPWVYGSETFQNHQPGLQPGAILGGMSDAYNTPYPSTQSYETPLDHHVHMQGTEVKDNGEVTSGYAYAPMVPLAMVQHSYTEGTEENGDVYKPTMSLTSPSDTHVHTCTQTESVAHVNPNLRVQPSVSITPSSRISSTDTSHTSVDIKEFDNPMTFNTPLEEVGDDKRGSDDRIEDSVMSEENVDTSDQENVLVEEKRDTSSTSEDVDREQFIQSLLTSLNQDRIPIPDPRNESYVPVLPYSLDLSTSSDETVEFGADIGNKESTVSRIKLSTSRNDSSKESSVTESSAIDSSIVSTEKAPSEKSHPLSLQEAFLLKKQSFVEKSKTRLSELGTRAKEREKKISKIVPSKPLSGSGAGISKEKTVSFSSPLLQGSRGPPARLFSKAKEKISTKEMHERNLRLYHKLPEVQERQKILQRQELYAKNRERAKSYHQNLRKKMNQSKM